MIYGAVKLECGFRADLVVEQRVVVELKCKDAIHPVDEAQLLSHLRLLNISIGLLINFHVVLLRDGIRRMVNNYCAVKEELLTAKGAKKKHGSLSVKSFSADTQSRSSARHPTAAYNRGHHIELRLRSR